MLPIQSERGNQRIERGELSGNIKSNQPCWMKVLFVFVSASILATHAGCSNQDRTISNSSSSETQGLYSKASTPSSGPGKEVESTESQKLPTSDETESAEFRKIFRKAGEITFRGTDLSSINRCKADSQGNIYVIDMKQQRVLKFDDSGNFLKVIGKRGKEPGSLVWPSDIEIDTEDNVYISDFSAYRVSKFDSEGNFLDSFIFSPQKFSASRLALDTRHGVVYLGGHQYQKKEPEQSILLHRFTSAGRYVRSYFPSDKFISQLNLFSFCEMGMVLDEEGNVYTYQSPIYKIYKFSSDGTLVKTFGRNAPFFNSPTRTFSLKNQPAAEYERWVQTWTPLSNLVSTNHNLILSIKTLKPWDYTLEIYDQNGVFLTGQIGSSYKLLSGDRRGSLYFLLNEAGGRDYRLGKFSTVANGEVNL